MPFCNSSSLKIILLISAIFSFLVLNASAYTIKGSPQCSDIFLAKDGKYTDNETAKRTFTFWMLGYITGANMMHEEAGGHGEFGKGVEPEEIYELVIEWCQVNPQSQMADVLKYILNEID